MLWTRRGWRRYQGANRNIKRTTRMSAGQWDPPSLMYKVSCPFPVSMVLSDRSVTVTTVKQCTMAWTHPLISGVNKGWHHYVVWHWYRHTHTHTHSQSGLLAWPGSWCSILSPKIVEVCLFHWLFKYILLHQERRWSYQTLEIEHDELSNDIDRRQHTELSQYHYIFRPSDESGWIWFVM